MGKIIYRQEDFYQRTRYHEWLGQSAISRQASGKISKDIYTSHFTDPVELKGSTIKQIAYWYSPCSNVNGSTREIIAKAHHRAAFQFTAKCPLDIRHYGRGNILPCQSRNAESTYRISTLFTWIQYRRIISSLVVYHRVMISRPLLLTVKVIPSYAGDSFEHSSSSGKGGLAS